MTARGIVIRESIIGQILPSELDTYVVKKYPYKMDGVVPVEILVLEVGETELSSVLFVFMELLIEGYYAHFVEAEKDKLYVVFPHNVCVVLRNDEITAERCRAIGRTYNIPVVQMSFEELFEEDHPHASV